MNAEPAHLSQAIIGGNKRAVARAITLIENNASSSDLILKEIFPHTGKAHRIGITGPPGVGKSTLSNQLIKTCRKNGLRVGVIAVDPSSPFTGGAILGDRVRMQELFTDPDVFIRSMATRGSLGGLARQAGEAADVLDASGKDIILLETVGVGQVELDIMDAADTIVVITVPETGDVIQGMKAGLMEIGDLFVINKADLEGAERMRTDLEFVLELNRHKTGWTPGVLMTESRKGTGIQELYHEIKKHRAYLQEGGRFRERRLHRLRERVKTMIHEQLSDSFWNNERIQLLEDLLPIHSPWEIVGKVMAVEENRTKNKEKRKKKK